MVVIFGSPGLFEVYDVYNVIHEKIRTCKKPIYVVLPSVVNVKNEIDDFIAKGNTCFPDEVLFGKALGTIFNTPKPIKNTYSDFGTAEFEIRKIIETAKNGYLEPQQVMALLTASKIPLVQQAICKTKEDCISEIKKIGFPTVMKVVGPIHKSDVGGIILNINSEEKMIVSFDTIMKIEGATSVLLQPMKKGIELFIGAKKESNFGHLVLCGIGGIYIEILKDVKTCLVPVSKEEATNMIQQLKSYKIIQGIRNQEGVNELLFSEIIEKISNLVTIAPEIVELDLNPLLGNSKEIIAVDARIRIEKN